MGSPASGQHRPPDGFKIMNSQAREAEDQAKRNYFIKKKKQLLEIPPFQREEQDNHRDQRRAIPLLNRKQRPVRECQ